MRTFLLQPYPFGQSLGRKLRVCAAVGLFVALFLAIFQPFGINELPARQQWLHPVLFGLVSFAVSSLFQVVVPRLLPRVFAEERWKAWKEIVFLLLILLGVSAGNYLLMNLLYPAEMGYGSFIPVLWITMEVGVFPIVFIVFMKQMLLYRRYAAAALQVNQNLEAPASGEGKVQDAGFAPTSIVLQGEGQKEYLELSLKKLLLIASSDNYVQVVFEAEGAVRSQLLRATLKNMEQQLAAFPPIFRCHRMYLVHLDKVEQVSGNAQGLRLHLQGVEMPIPVSRSLTQTVKERLAHLSHSPQTA